MTSLTDTIRTLENAFVSGKRDNGDVYIYTRKESPEWINDAIRAIHGDMFPNDWHYAVAYRLAMEWQCLDPGDSDDMRDAARICADSMVIYPHDVAQWLAGNFCERCERMDSIRRDYETDADTMTLARMAMHDEITDIAGILISAIESESEQ